MKFYELDNADKFQNAEWAEEMDYTDTIYCPANPGHQRAGRRMEHLVITLPSSRIGDFVWTGVGECIITDRVAQLFKEAGFTGYELRPVTVSKVYRHHVEKDIVLTDEGPRGIKKVTRDRNPRPIPRLWELKIIGKGGNIHPDSGISIKIKRICDACGAEKISIRGRGIIVDEKQWDGSDFFFVTEFPGMRLVTERVKDFIIGERLTNCKLIPSEEIHFPVFPYEEET